MTCRRDTTSDSHENQNRVEDRQDSGSVLITSQFAVTAWHELIGNSTVADALLDRLVHHAHRIELKGESMRKMKSRRKKTNT